MSHNEQDTAAVLKMEQDIAWSILHRYRAEQIWHADAHFCTALFKYMFQRALQLNEHCLVYFMDNNFIVGAHETYTWVQSAIDALKGNSGLDKNGLFLFQDNAAVDEFGLLSKNIYSAFKIHQAWTSTPSPNMWLVTLCQFHTTPPSEEATVWKDSTVRGKHSLEGFHRFLLNMILGNCSAAVPFQVYLSLDSPLWCSLVFWPSREVCLI